jgi:SEC-C motif-containing protein
MNNKIDELQCLCGSQVKYNSCCQPYHDDTNRPDTAEQLMRSRFTAYAMRNTDYLLKTWDTSKRPDEIDFSKEGVVWTKLEIVSTKKGKATDSKGLVEFKAYYESDNEEYVMKEMSRFKKQVGQWLYLDGLVSSVGKVGQQTNQGKNAPCSCGSGKKFKRCCGK